MKSPGSTVDLRQANSQIVLRQLYFNGPMSRWELSRRTNLSLSTVTNVTSDMFQDGRMINIGEQESTEGRPRTILDINPEYGYLIGEDAICTGAACLVLDEFMFSNQKFNRLAT